MDKITVVVGWPLTLEQVRQIQDVSPDLEVHVIDYHLMEQPYFPTPGTMPELDALLTRCQVLMAMPFPVDAPERAPNLRWVQIISAGVNNLRGTPVWDRPIMLTVNRGVPSRGMAEYALTWMLMFVKEMPCILGQQANGEWDRSGLVPGYLMGKTVGILGLGGAGGELARICKALDMRVLATRRTTTHREEAYGDVDVLLPPTGIHEILRESDFVVVAMPLTPETEGLIGAEELRLMKPTAYLINISRGAIVVEEALVDALRERQIAGAGLDAFTTEPLPADSPLRDLPNVFLSPHVSGVTVDQTSATVDLFCENMRRFLNGEGLINEVDKAIGY